MHKRSIKSSEEINNYAFIISTGPFLTKIGQQQTHSLIQCWAMSHDRIMGSFFHGVLSLLHSYPTHLCLVINNRGHMFVKKLCRKSFARLENT